MHNIQWTIDWLSSSLLSYICSYICRIKNGSSEIVQFPFACTSDPPPTTTWFGRPFRPTEIVTLYSTTIRKERLTFQEQVMESLILRPPRWCTCWCIRCSYHSTATIEMSLANCRKGCFQELAWKASSLTTNLPLGHAGWVGGLSPQ